MTNTTTQPIQDATMTTQDRLVTMRQAGELLACSRGQLYNLINRGQLIPVKIGGGTRFRLSDLEALINAGRGVPLRRTAA